ncbi:MAG: NAD(P)H-dependent oxidoreductase [Treponemataceae bacterium]|nr:NAD(P)H-dependent oxidoreductase [Treponemataceae bacterium]
MKIVIINGQNHKGSTEHIGRMLAEKVGGEITEFFLPRDFSTWCCGCSQCFMDSEKKCPGYASLQPIVQVMDEADLLILTSPVYVYHASGPMKNFLDHFGYRWMVHRPVPAMFKKQAVVISTAAGSGMKSTCRDMADSLFFWGVPKTYRIGIAVRAIKWDAITPKHMQNIERQVAAVARKIVRGHGKVKPGLKTKGFFMIMRMMQKGGGWNKADNAYWKEHGWLDGNRPWR